MGDLQIIALYQITSDLELAEKMMYFVAKAYFFERNTPYSLWKRSIPISTFSLIVILILP
jgi:hypothetical protein